MARKGLTGQLNMFDLFKSMEDIPMGEVQMVSLMPEDEPEVMAEPEEVAEPEVVTEPEEVAEPLVVEEPETVVETQKIEEIQKSIDSPIVVVEETKKSRAPRNKSSKVEKNVEEIPELVKERRIVSSGNDKPAMCRQYVIDGQQLEIAYINYNKVRITREGQEPEIHIFESSKEAVDYYVQKMQELEPEEE